MFAPILTTPINGDIESENVTLKWIPAYDTFNNTIYYSIEYSSDNKATWIPIVSGLNVTTYTWDTRSIAEGSYIVRITAYERSNMNSTSVNILVLHQNFSNGISFINSNSKQIPIGDTIEVTYQLKNSFSIAVLAELSFNYNQNKLKIVLPNEGQYQNVLIPGSSKVSIIFRFESLTEIKENQTFSLTLTLTKFHFMGVINQNNWINLNLNSKIDLIVYKSHSKSSPGFEWIFLGIILISLSFTRKIKKIRSKNFRSNE